MSRRGCGCCVGDCEYYEWYDNLDGWSGAEDESFENSGYYEWTDGTVNSPSIGNNKSFFIEVWLLSGDITIHCQGRSFRVNESNGTTDLDGVAAEYVPHTQNWTHAVLYITPDHYHGIVRPNGEAFPAEFGAVQSVTATGNQNCEFSIEAHGTARIARVEFGSRDIIEPSGANFDWCRRWFPVPLCTKWWKDQHEPEATSGYYCDGQSVPPLSFTSYGGRDHREFPDYEWALKANMESAHSYLDQTSESGFVGEIGCDHIKLYGCTTRGFQMMGKAEGLNWTGPRGYTRMVTHLPDPTASEHYPKPRIIAEAGITGVGTYTGPAGWPVSLGQTNIGSTVVYFDQQGTVSFQIVVEGPTRAEMRSAVESKTEEPEQGGTITYGGGLSWDV